jgi:hypothetical protein
VTRRIFGPSHKRGVELAAAGCPLDYLDAVKDSAAAGNSFWAQKLPGYAESSVYVLGPSLTGFVIGLRLGTNLVGGTEIAEWNFQPPWPEHSICWEYEPPEIIPAPDLGRYRHVLDSRLSEILDDRQLLRRGCPVQGLLCGFSNQPLPESAKGLAAGKLTLVDDKQNVVSLRIDLRMYAASSATPFGSTLRPRRRGALLDKVDEIPVGRKY